MIKLQKRSSDVTPTINCNTQCAYIITYKLDHTFLDSVIWPYSTSEKHGQQITNLEPYTTAMNDGTTNYLLYARLPKTNHSKHIQAHYVFMT